MDKNWRQNFVGITTQVPTVEGKRPYINFDNAATTPPFAASLRAVNDFAPWYASVHRGSGLKSRVSTESYEDARCIAREFVGANDADHVVIFNKNTTESINKLSYRLGLHRRDIVLISYLEHHSNDLPWRASATVKRIKLTADGAIDTEDFLRLLSRYKSRIKLVAISGASNVTGYLPDIHWMARKTHEINAQIFVDCAQLVAHRPIDMKPLNHPEHLDYIAFSAHKMYAPFGCGVLIGRRDTFLRGNPEYVGGGTISSVTIQTVDWADLPDKEEAGTPNAFGVMAFAAAIRSLKSIGFEAIQAHEAMLTSYALRALCTVPGLRLYGDTHPETAPQRSAVIPFTIRNVPAQLVAACLGYEWGIGVRSGCFCAQPYVVKLLGLDEALTRSQLISNRRDLLPGMVRVSFGLYNTTDEIDRLVVALKTIAAGRHNKYDVNGHTGEYIPRGVSKVPSLYFDIK